MLALVKQFGGIRGSSLLLSKFTDAANAARSQLAGLFSSSLFLSHLILSHLIFPDLTRVFSYFKIIMKLADDKELVATNVAEIPLDCCNLSVSLIKIPDLLQNSEKSVNI